MKKEIKLWDDVAKSFHKTSITSRAHSDKYKKIARLIVDSNPLSILDLGCGSGILEKELINLNFKGKTLAIDGSSKMLDIARSYVPESNVLFTYGDLDNPIKLKEKFDVVVSINLLFFLENKESFFKNVSGTLRDNNSLFLLVIPKPTEESNVFAFIMEHFAGTNLGEKILILINEVINIPKYFKMTLNQLKIDKLEKKGIVKYDTIEDIQVLSRKSGLSILTTEEIHAKQNWLFIMRRG